MNEVNTAIASSLEGLTGQYRAITTNLANSSTTAYKRRCSSFSQALAQASSAGGKVSGHTTVDFTQGPLVKTDRNMDVALEGKGFLVVETPQGPLYTRDGAFRVNARGQLVDYAGRSVSGQNGPIMVPATAGAASVSFADDGTVSAKGVPIGKLKLVEFADTTKLVPVGPCSFTSAESPDASKTTEVHQDFREGSNVNLVEELVSLITVSRLYEANLKNVSTKDDSFRNLIQVAMG